MRFRVIGCGLLAGVAWAQASAPSNSRTVGVVLSGTPPEVPARIAISGGFAGSFPQNGIMGQPYSAQQETETVQTLADGTHITAGLQKVTMYRDSQGRTRMERTSVPPAGFLQQSAPPVFIDVSDPVGGYRYTLDANSHRAYRSSVVPSPRTARPALVPTPVAVPAALPPVILPAPVPNQMPRPEIVRDQLGTQSIEGVIAEGVRTTTTYPVGFFGNDRPLTTINEQWTSRELGMTVLSKMSDPRSGVTTTKLFSISRAEPDASLFQPPAGYEIVDAQSDVQRK